jgi:homoserine dehydrogenase
MISLFGKSVGRLSFYGQGAGKYPTGNSLAQDVIDILNGDTTLTYPKSIVKVDNSEIARTYYVRTSCDLDKCLICSKETVDGINYIITNKISVKDMHEVAKAIFAKDSCAFFAGIEE